MVKEVHLSLKDTNKIIRKAAGDSDSQEIRGIIHVQLLWCFFNQKHLVKDKILFPNLMKLSLIVLHLIQMVFPLYFIYKS